MKRMAAIYSALILSRLAVLLARCWPILSDACASAARYFLEIGKRGRGNG